MYFTWVDDIFPNVGDTLLVGTKQGHLLVYTVRAGRGETKFEVSLERSNKSFSKKPIIQVSDKEILTWVTFSGG